MMYQAGVPDRSITQKVDKELCSRGVRPPCHITVVTNKGNVTLSGTIQYEHQRRMVVHTARAVDGVQRVVDQLRVIPKVQQWK
ncbi:MAG: BON domain-containing protein [Pirellulales bacterium]|jgi:osmotically-inducible protein OsmY